MIKIFIAAWTLMLASAGARAAPVETISAAHYGAWTGDSIEWESDFIIGSTDPDDELQLVAPLPANTEVLDADGTEPVRNDSGEIVAFTVLDGGHRLWLRLRQDVVPGDTVLHPPIGAWGSLQRITLTGGRFVADPVMSVEKRLGNATQPEITRKDRRKLNRALRHFGRVGPRNQPLFVVADGRIAEAGGVPGTLTAGTGPRAGPVLAVGGVFVGVIVLLALGYRLLDKPVRDENVDAYLEQEFIWPIVAPPAESAPEPGTPPPLSSS